MHYSCMVTTIQLNENVKSELDKFKLNKETYEQIILNLMKTVQEYQRNQEIKRRYFVG